MLSTLQALPLQPDAASGTVEHLTQLCLLRFADPSPSGYTIPGQLPSPVSYSSASQGSTPGTANSLATAHGAPSPSAGRQLQQVASVPVIKYLPSPVSVFCTLPVTSTWCGLHQRLTGLGCLTLPHGAPSPIAGRQLQQALYMNLINLPIAGVSLAHSFNSHISFLISGHDDYHMSGGCLLAVLDIFCHLQPVPLSLDAQCLCMMW